MRERIKIFTFIFCILLFSNYLWAFTFIIESALFEGIRIYEKEEKISPLIFLTISKFLEQKSSKQAKQLKYMFNLSAVHFLQRGKILWHPRDENGKVIWSDFKRDKIFYPTIKATLTIGKEEYFVFLSPSNIDVKKDIKLKIEVYREKETQNQENKYGIVFSKGTDLKRKGESILKTEITVTWYNPIILGFYKNKKIYFLSLYNAYSFGSPVSGIKKNLLELKNP